MSKQQTEKEFENVVDAGGKDPFGGLGLKDACQIIRRSKHVHANWYRATYPDVDQTGMDPAEHYLKYGAVMGRRPGKGFDPKFYLETYPDVVESGLNPLLHYALYGKEKGYHCKSYETAPDKKELKKINAIRTKLLSLGFIDQPIIDLRGIQATSDIPAARAAAARELALWNMRAKTDEGYRTALAYIDKARSDAPDQDFRQKLATVELLCHYFLGDFEAARKSYDRAALDGEIGPDLLLARANLDRSAQGRCRWINWTLDQFNISPIKLIADDETSPYDQLTSQRALPVVSDGPMVTVLLAAYDAADTLPTALRSLQEQTWKNLEILVIDDCSPDGGATCEVVEAFAKKDPRIKLIRMEQNGGAYVARNRGLDQAAGEYVTIHDADDWSHPQKIETQVRHLSKNAQSMGCTSQQARAYSDLTFGRWTGQGQFIITNTSSFMFRRAPMREQLGYWDTVRFSADNELIRRMRAVFGKESVNFLETGPLSFQRDSATSIVADEVLGVNGFMFGARKEYLDAQNHHRETAAVLNYANLDQARPFPAPGLMKPNRREIAEKGSYIPVVTGTELRMPGGSVESTLQELMAAKKYGISTGIFEMHRYDVDFGEATTRGHMLSEVRSAINENNARILTFGEEIDCDLLIIRYPPVLFHRQRYLPKINAKHIKVIVNQPPMSDYSPEGVVRYRLEGCAENIRNYFGKDAEWHPIGPLVREALMTHHSHELHYIKLSDEDWTNIIDIQSWSRGARTRGPGDRLRIGRHSRDNFVKWPATREDVLAAYPASGDIEVHVLGGAKAPAALIGGIPANWTVHEFGAMHPRDFLRDIDVFVYFSHPDWIESFGRTIIEAMAVGVPVVLPEVYRPLFRDAAVYATPATAVEAARRLHENPKLYERQVEFARKYAADNFSFEMHIRRLNNIKESLREHP